MTIVNQIVDRCHVGDDYGSVRRYVLSRMKRRNGHSLYWRQARSIRHEVLKAVTKRHRDNRAQYHRVMTGRF